MKAVVEILRQQIRARESLRASPNGMTQYSVDEHQRVVEQIKAGIAVLEAAPQPAPQAGPVGEIEFDGYKGAKNVRWYINELHRVRFLNQWLADAYCNELRAVYLARAKARGMEEQRASSEANNKVAEIWRGCRDEFDGYLRHGFKDPEDPVFHVKHDAVSERMLSAIAAPQPAPQAGPEKSEALHYRHVGWVFEFPDKRLAPKFDVCPHGGNWKKVYVVGDSK